MNTFTFILGFKDFSHFATGNLLSHVRRTGPIYKETFQQVKESPVQNKLEILKTCVMEPETVEQVWCLPLQASKPV